tara:strand:+ start:186568 stop:187572 length:1005 start_codon:yes stop_codon:yes gene_type:complete
MLHSTFRQLEVFVSVVNAGSFVASAERLDISQPAVSNHIRALESQVGFTVLERRRGTICVLTEEGRNLYERAVGLLEIAHKIALEMPRSGTQRGRRPLRVWTQYPIMNRWLKSLVPQFVLDHAEVELSVELGSFEEAVRQIRDREVDIAYFMGSGEIAEFSSEVVHLAPHGIFARADHPQVIEFGKNPDALRDLRLILPRRNSHFFRVIDKCLTQAGIDRYGVSCELRDAPIIKEMILAGHVGSLFHHALADEIERGEVVQLVELPPIEIRQVFQPRATAAKAAGLFVGRARQIFDSELHKFDRPGRPLVTSLLQAGWRTIEAEAPGEKRSKTS